jgi:putative cardiolipin synthase
VSVENARATNSLSLQFLGASADVVQQSSPPQVTLYVAQDAEAVRNVNVWPSAFSGWETVALKHGLWGQRVVTRGVELDHQEFVVNVPTTDAMLTVVLDCQASDSEWPSYMQDLLYTIRYSGKGLPVSPPSTDGGDRSRTASRSPSMSPSPDALADSPLHSFVPRLRQALDQGVDPSDNNYAVLLENGADAMLARLHLIRSAKHSIRIQTFIWSDDEAGRLLLYELIEAAKRGVDVKIIADHMSSFRDVELAAFVSTVSTNLHFRHYRPAAKRIDPVPLQEAVNFLVPNKTNQRMHNKLFIVDDAVAITGGRNIENTYYAQSNAINFKDRDVLFTGPMVGYALQSFDEYWTFDKTVRTERLVDVRRVIRRGKFRKRETREDFELEGRFDKVSLDADNNETVTQRIVSRIRPVDKALFLADPPGKASRAYTAHRRGTIARQLEHMMRSAQQSLVLQTPYLVLDGGMLKIFKTLRKENPKIQIMASSNSFGATDNPVVYAAGVKMRRTIFRAGIELFEFRPEPAIMRQQIPDYDALLKGDNTRVLGLGVQDSRPFMCIHAKAMVIDERVAFVGSYNFDPRSIQWNTEVGLLVHDDDFSASVLNSVLVDIRPENSWVLARRQSPRSQEDISRQLPAEMENTRAAIDFWPFRHTSGYALKQGHAIQIPETPPFYRNYEDVGTFPGADDEELAFKKVVACLSTTLSGLLVPLL